MNITEAELNKKALDYSMGAGSYRSTYFEEDIKKSFEAGYRECEKDVEASELHTCHDECQKPLCVKFREKDARIKELKSELSILRYAQLVNKDEMELARNEITALELQLKELEEIIKNDRDENVKKIVTHIYNVDEYAEQLELQLKEARKIIAEIPNYGPQEPALKACWFCDMGNAGYSSKGTGYHDDKCLWGAARNWLAKNPEVKNG